MDSLGPWKLGGDVESIIRTKWAIFGFKAGFFDRKIRTYSPKSGLWPVGIRTGVGRGRQVAGTKSGQPCGTLEKKKRQTSDTVTKALAYNFFLRRFKFRLGIFRALAMCQAVEGRQSHSLFSSGLQAQYQGS